MVGVDDLASSIKTDGLLSPIVVTKEGERYRIIAGERRYHAMKKLGWQEVEVRIISREQRDYFRIALIENLQRENLTPEDEASALLRLKTQENYSDHELSSIIGKSRNYVTEILGIANLPDEVLAECRAAGIDNKNMMIQVVQAFKKGNWKELLEAYKEGSIRTVRGAREFIQGRSQGGEKKSDRKKSSDDKSLASTFSLQKKGPRLTIHCPSPEQAKNLEQWIRSNYPGWTE
jgi:ParB family chromosome partitioning protein